VLHGHHGARSAKRRTHPLLERHLLVRRPLCVYLGVPG
jgi:hypothetical protein